MFGWHYGEWAWGGVVMAVVMLAFWALVIFGIVWLVRQSSGRPGSLDTPQIPDAKAVLDRSFAAGEIDEQEYRSRLAVLADGDREHQRAP